MIHLFRVHSPLTYAMARQVARVQQLPDDAVRLVLSRNFQPPADNPFVVLPLPFSHYPVDSFAVQIAFWRSWSKVRAFDRWIDEITDGQPFYWYADHSYSSIFHLAVTHRACRGYYYHEEGAIVYRDPADWAIRKKANPLRDCLYWLNFGRRNSAQRSYFTTHIGQYLGCFGATEASFGNLAHKQIVGNPFPKRIFAEQYPCILVHDAIYDQFPPERYLAWIELMAKDALQRGFQQIYQKFHPAQKTETIQRITAFLQDYLAGKAVLKNLTAADSIEEIAISQQSTLYICISSAGLYAHLGGAKVISIFERCCQDEPSMQAAAYAFPPFYKKAIEWL